MGGWGDIALYSADELLVVADEGVELIEHALLGGAAALAVAQELAAGFHPANSQVVRPRWRSCSR